MSDTKSTNAGKSTNPFIMIMNEPGRALVSSLLETAASDVQAEECLQALENIEKTWNDNDKDPSISSIFWPKLITIGTRAYSVKNYPVAETAFRLLAESNDITGINNYAFMIRRHEIAKVSDRDHILALKILQQGLKREDSFSLVNTALVFALMIGDDDSWHLSDSIFSCLPSFICIRIGWWWEVLARKNDIEGYLVLFFLLRHRKIKYTSLGSINSLALRLKNNIQGLPEWLVKDYITISK